MPPTNSKPYPGPPRKSRPIDPDGAPCRSSTPHAPVVETAPRGRSAKRPTRCVVPPSSVLAQTSYRPQLAQQTRRDFARFFMGWYLTSYRCLIRCCLVSGQNPGCVFSPTTPYQGRHRVRFHEFHRGSVWQRMRSWNNR